MTNNDHHEPHPEEHSGLLDKEWERIQKKTFTHWVNSHLRRRQLGIADLTHDLRDGKMLHNLLEIISEEKLPRMDKGSMRVHNVSNVNKCLKFVTEKGVKLIGIGSEEIVDGNPKMTLGMIWTIILRFALCDVGDSSMSARDGLLLWCQRKTEPYANVKVTNFSTTWKDGLAFCALIHRHRPELIDYHSLSKANPADNLELAFSVAEKHFDIPRMLDIEDMAMPAPDEKSVITYVSCYYQAFSTSHELVTAARKVSNIFSQSKDIFKLTNDYEELANRLANWMEETKPTIVDRTIESDDIDTFRGLKKDLAEYRSNDKAKWADEKNNLQNIYNSLLTLLRINNRVEYVPPERLRLDNLDKHWKDLESEERLRLKWINDNIKRLQDLSALVRKFNNKCSLHESWARNQFDVLGASDCEGLELFELHALERKHEAFVSDTKSHMRRVNNIEEVLKVLRGYDYFDIDTLQKRYDNLISQNQAMLQAIDEYSERLNKAIEYAKKYEELQVEYAKLASDFRNWCDENVDDLSEHFTAHNVNDVNQLIEAHNSFKETGLVEASKKLDNVKQVNAELVQHASAMKNRSTGGSLYTDVTVDMLNNIWDEVQELTAQKDSTLADELDRQTRRAAKAEEIQECANTIQTFCDQMHELIKSNSTQFSKLEDQQANLQKLDKQINAFYMEHIPVLQKLVSEIDEFPQTLDEEVLPNKQAGYSQLNKTVSTELNLLANQILIRDSSSISEAKMSEYKMIFEKIDKDHVGYLNIDQFRNYLVALDYNVTKDDPAGEREFASITPKVDVNQNGEYTLANFLNYLATASIGQNSGEDLIASFKVLAGGLDYILPDVLRKELDDHAEEAIKAMKPFPGAGSGGIPAEALDYLAFANDLYGASEL